MVRVRVNRNEAGYITGFVASGHANADESGHDIVCAAVSALTHTAVISLAKHAPVRPLLKMDEPSGMMDVRLPSGLAGKPFERAQLILETMVLGLDEVAKEYGQYVVVSETQHH